MHSSPWTKTWSLPYSKSGRAGDFTTLARMLEVMVLQTRRGNHLWISPRTRKHASGSQSTKATKQPVRSTCRWLGVCYVTTRDLCFTFFKSIKRRLGVSFALEIIMLMAWCIWTTRNDWIFSNMHPTVQNCKTRSCSEFSLQFSSTGWSNP